LVGASCLVSGAAGGSNAPVKSRKAFILGILLGAIGAWAVWYFFIREKTIGEKLEDAGESLGRSVDKVIDKVD
jgi:hypothetical protein